MVKIAVLNVTVQTHHVITRLENAGVLMVTSVKGWSLLYFFTT